MSTLKQYLKSKQITQTDFAALIDSTQGNVAKLAGDNPKLSIETAVRIEKATDGAVPIEAWPQFAILAERARAGEVQS